MERVGGGGGREGWSDEDLELSLFVASMRHLLAL